MITPREAILLCAAIGFAGAVSAAWLHGHHAGVAAERPKVEAAADDASARTHEAEGERAITAQIDQNRTTAVAAAAIVADATVQARSAPDAHQDLDPDRARRLHDADQRLCDLEPRICAAPAADAEERDGALPAVPASGRAE